MKKLVRQVLVDVDSPDGANPGHWTAKLIDPEHAVQWIATGHFSYGTFSLLPEGPARDWWACTPNFSDDIFEGEDGRIGLALELVTEAVEQGRLRLFYVAAHTDPSEAGIGKRLEAVPVEQFAGFDVHATHEDGQLKVYVGDPVEHDNVDHDELTFEGFWLSWDEVLRMRPSYARQAIENSAALTPRVSVEHADPMVVLNTRGKRRGRRPKAHGGPIAAFLAQMVAEGIDKVRGLTDDALGASLIASYQRFRQPAPDPRNAASDARGAIEAWFAAQPKPV